MTIHCRCTDMTSLLGRDHDEMYGLFSRHFDNTDRDRFEADLAQKQWVLQLVDSVTGELRGFSTQTLVRFRWRQQSVRAVFSGDTIVDPEVWGETALIRQWGRLVADLLRSNASEPLYWFLISKGYKTYRFLPVFFREFYPRFDQAKPVWAQEILDVLGDLMFPDDYDSQRGILIASPHKDRLRPGLARVEESRLLDPHIRFFLESNPGYARGDELCCLAPLDFGNFKPAGIRLFDPENRPKQAGINCE